LGFCCFSLDSSFLTGLTFSFESSSLTFISSLVSLSSSFLMFLFSFLSFFAKKSVILLLLVGFFSVFSSPLTSTIKFGD